MEQDKELKQGVELTNEKQESALSKLRASIQAQRDARSAVFQSSLELPQRMELITVPEITIESATEFSLERYGQLCERTDKAFHNYLCHKTMLDAIKIETLVAFEEALKLLTECIELTLVESTKIRFSKNIYD